MRRIIPILLLILHLSAVIRPYFPYIEYTLNKNYIATVLCINKDKPMLHCDGKCYLAKKLKAAAEKEKNSKPIKSAKQELSVTFFCQDMENWQALHGETIQKAHNPFINSIYLQNSADTPTPPPKFS